VGGRGKKQDRKNEKEQEKKKEIILIRNRKMTERERGWNVKQQNKCRKNKNC
jgi:hypothetical protein